MSQYPASVPKVGLASSRPPCFVLLTH